jgi:hypothetical protein
MGFLKRLFGLEHKVYPEHLPQYNEETDTDYGATFHVPLTDTSVVKRGRGRPRKTPIETGVDSLARPIRPISDTPKRGRGRPRKTEAATPVQVAAAKKPKKGKATKKGKPAKKGY